MFLHNSASITQRYFRHFVQSFIQSAINSTNH